MNGRKKVSLGLARCVRLVIVWSIVLAVAVGPMAVYGLGVEPDGGMALREEKAPREEGVDVYGLPSWTTVGAGSPSASASGDYGNGGGGEALPDGDGGDGLLRSARNDDEKVTAKGVKPAADGVALPYIGRSPGDGVFAKGGCASALS